MPKKLSDAAVQALNSARTMPVTGPKRPGDFGLVLPEQLDRKIYTEVNAALQEVGGTWNRKLKAHVFAEDPRDKIAAMIADGERPDVGKDFGFFATPPELADRMVELLGPIPQGDDGLWTLLSGLGISDLIQAPIETRTERGGLVRYVEIYTVNDGFKPDEFVAVVREPELRALGQLALTAQEAEKQHAGAVRHLEAVRAELVKVTAERDVARADYHRLLYAVESGTNDRRRRLPAERQGVTHAFAIHTPEGRHKGYITVGLYDDGSVGEVFLKLDQQGSQVSGFCDAWSIAVSMLLQTGTSLETVCRKFRGARFEPSGRTETPGIRVALSPVDYAARYLERRFVSKLPLTDDDAGPPAEGEV